MDRPEGSSWRPDPATSSTTDFVDTLRRLREWSGLTYRELEGKAAADGSVLPPSTIASTLGRTTLPREQFVDAFVRACGLDDDGVKRWVEARRQLAGGAVPPAAEPVGTDRRVPRKVIALVVVGAVSLLGGLGLLGYATFGPLSAGSAPAPPSEQPGRRVPPVDGLPINDVGSWALIHPFRTPDLCVTEGTDRSGRYRSEVAAQRPCATLPRTYLEPLGDGTVQVQWHHPVHGVGCLTVIDSGAGRDLVEPRDDCATFLRAQSFHLDPVQPNLFRLRLAGTDDCLGPRDEGLEEGVELIREPCSASPAQRFAVELRQPPG